MTNKLSTMLSPSLAYPTPNLGARSGIRWIAPALILLLALAAALGSGSAAAQSSDLDPIIITGRISFVGPSGPVTEGETAVFTVTRTVTSGTLRIPYQATELRGEGNTPVYTESGEVIFADGEGERTIRLSIPDDNSVEKKNRFKVDLPIIIGSFCSGLPCPKTFSETVQIQDNDRYHLSIDSPSVDEGLQGATDLTFTARLSHPTSFPVEVDYVVGGTATAGPDYTDADYRDQLTIDGADAPLEGTFTFPPGEKQKRITVTVNGDKEIEEDETVVVEVELANDDDKALAFDNGREASGTGTIRNDDDPVDSISIAGPAQPVPEGQTAEFTVTRTNTSGTKQLTYSTCAIRGASDNPTPHVADCHRYSTGGNVSFQSGEGEKTIRFQTRDDDYVEQHDRVRVTLFTNPSLLATARIQDNDRYSLHVDEPSVVEGDSGAAELTFNVDLSKPADFPVEVNYTVSDRGTADAGDDYQNQQGTVTFAPGETEKQITVTVNGDADFEADETVVLEVELANDDDRAYAVANGHTASGSGTIENDDHYIISFREGSDGYENVAGSNAPVPVQFKVTLDPEAPGTVEVDYETYDSPRPGLRATSGADFTRTSGTLTFDPGETEKTVAVTVLDDDLVENKEEVGLRLSNAQGFAVKIQPAAEGPDGTWFQYIHSDEGYDYLISVQNDGPDILTEPASGATASLSFVLNLSSAASGPVMVDYQTVDGTAISGGAAGEDDYASASGTLTFETGDASKTINVTVNGDDVFEDGAPESLWLLLSNPRGPSGTNVGFELDNLGFEKRSFLGLIADNPPRLKLTVDAPTALESDVGGTPLLPFFFTLRMNQPQQEEVTVRVGSGGTAIGTGGAPDRTTDYIRPALGNVTFKPGETEKELRFYVLPDNRVEEDETVEITVTAPPIFNPSGDDDVVIVATGTILNNDHQVWANWPKVTEGAAGETTPLTFKVTLRPPVSSGEVTIDYQTADRTHGHGAHQNDIDADWIGSNDYEAKSGTLTFPANTGRQEIEVTVNGDDFDEHDEYFILELSGLSGPEGIRLEFPPGSKGNYRGTIKDDDDFAYRVPTEENTQSVPEGAWRMLIDGRRRYQTFVRLELWTNRQWYGNHASCNAGEGGTAVGAANGRDHGDYYQSVPSPGVPGGTNVHSTFISHAYSGGPVDWTDDFGETGYQNSVWCHLPIWGDPFVEDDETVVVEYQHSAVGHGADNPITLGTITILNDDHALSVDSPSVDEGDTGTAELVFTVTLDPPSTGTVTVDYATSDGTAKAGGDANTGGDDYEPKSGTLTFAAGETTQTVTVIVNGDETYEGARDTQDETVLLTFSNPSGPGFSTIKLPGEQEPAGGRIQPGDPAYTPPQPIQHPSGTIRHDDPFPTVSIGAPAAPVVEGEDLVFPVTLSKAHYEATWRVRYQLLADGSATRGEDYTAEGYNENTWGIVELAPGQTKASITLKTTDDTAVEDDETVRVQLSRPPETNNFQVDSSKNTATGTITDNDLPQVTVASDGDVTEGENAVFTLTRTRDTSSEITVTFTVTFTVTGGESALSGSAPTTATIAANAATATVSLATEDDTTDEPNATLTLTLADGDAYDLGSDSAATLTVQDNDGTPALTVADAAAAEDADLTFAISLSPAGSDTVTVNYAITPGTAQAADYTGATSGALTFAPGETAKSVTLDVVDDTVDEPEETVTFTLSNHTGTASIEDATATGAITDNDLPSVTVASGGNVTEGADAEFTLTRASENTGAALPVTFTVTGGDAALTDDPPTTATIPADATTVTVTLATEDDNTDEPNATLTLTLTDGAAYDLGNDRAATLTVQDNDDTPTIRVADAAASEDADLVFEITLNPASSGTVTVNYAITPNTAQAADYTGTTSGSVTFAPGEASKDVTLELVDDALDETDETVTLTLSNLTGTASLGNATATGTITDNDAPVVTVASGGDVTEGENAEFTLTRASESIGQQLLVAFAVTDDDTVLTDAAPVSAVIPANATTVTVTLPTEDDDAEDDDATLTLTLTDGDAYDLGSDDTATLTVADNDTPEVSDTVVTVKAVKTTITEGDDAAFALTRKGGPPGQLDVSFRVTGGESVLSDDAPTSVTFGEDQATAPVILATDDDDTDELDATLTLTLTNSSDYNLSRNSASASVTVEDNDTVHAEVASPKVTVAAVDDPVMEGEDAVFRLTRTGDATAALPVTFSVTDPGSALTNAAPASATIPANVTTALVTLATTDDETDKPDTTLTLTLTDGDAYDLGSDSAATLTVQDNDLPVVTVTAGGDVTEGADAEFTLTRASENTGAALPVTFSVTGGAAALSDAAPTQATILTDETTVTVTLSTEDDNTDEPDATLTLTLTDGAAYDLGSDDTATLTVQDNDLPVVTVTSGGDITEGADAEFTLTRASQDTGAALEVTFSVSGGAAMLTAAAPTAATIPANQTTVTVTLATEDDNTDEPNATLTLTLADGAAYDLGSDRAATLTVQDNDDTPELTVADAAAAEDADLVFAINLDPASSGTVTVNYAITPNTAQAADYTGTTSGKVTFAPGDTSKNVTLELVDDTTDEPEETVTLTLSGLTGTASIADGTATGTITDNDLPSVTVTSGGDITEGADAEFTLTRASQDTGAALEVTFSVSGGAAMLTAAAPTSATIPANSTTVLVTMATADDNTDEPNATLTLTLTDGAAYDLGTPSVATLTVQDNDGAPALTANDASASEDADLVFEINLNPASSGTVTVNYAITPNTAQAADYTGTTSGSLTFAPGETTKDVTLKLVDDTADEPEETVTLTLSGPTGTASIADGTATGTITDNDLPSVTVTAGGNVTEGADAQFTLTRASQDTGAALPVTFSITGGAAMLSDAAPTSATIPANATTVTVTLATTDDNTDEPNATLTLTLTDGPAYDLGSDDTATLTVQDNDGTPALTANDASASEDADLVFEITLNPASSGTVTVNYAITPNTAQAADYTGTTSGKVTFAPGDTTKDVTLNLVDDTADEPEETVTLTLSGPTGTASIADGTATGAITDNDLPSVTVTAGGDITEGADAQFTLTRASQDTGAALPVTFSVTDPGSALTNAAPASATIPANATTALVTLATADDNIDKPDATLTLTLTDGDAYDLGSDDTATLTVQDNDLPVVTVASGDDVTEGADAEFTLTRASQDTGAALVVTFSVTGGAAALSDAAPTQATILTDETTVTVTLSTEDDNTDEPDATLTLTLTDGAAYDLGSDDTATLTVQDNDLPVVTVTSGGDITEGADAQFTLTRASQDTGAALTVTFSVTGGGSALTDAAPTAATIPANQTTATVSLATEDDNTDEPNATLTLTLTDGPAYDLGSDRAATLTVQDNDGAPALSANDASAAEDADLVFTINLNPASSGTVTVNYAITPDTAQAADYTGTTSGKVTFAPGDTSKDVTLNLVDDTADEPEETVTLTLSGPTGTASIADGTATGTITDNDLPSVTVTAGGDITEGADAEFTLTRASQDTGAALPVTFSVSDPGAALTDAAPTSATIPADATTVTVTLATTDDNTDEPHATLTLTLTDGAAYDLGSDDTATLTVQDNDLPVVTVASGDDVTEGADAEFTLTRASQDTGAALVVTFSVTGGAAALSDAAPTQATILTDETTVTVTLSTEDDNTDEPDATLTLTLTDGAAYDLGSDDTATLTVQDNDLPVVTVTAGGNVTEGADAQFTLTRASQDTGAALPVTFSVSDPGAALTDAAPTSATIPADATTVTVTLATTDDNTDEPNATLTLTLADGAAYDLGTPSVATLTVQDNDGAPALSANDASAAEDADLVFTINLNPASSGTVTVNYAITADTAQAADYTGTTSGKVTFAPGDTSKDVTLELVDDTTDEPDETVTLTLSDPTGTASIADGTATGAITDNDLPVVTVTAGGDITEGADAQFTLTRASQDTGAALPVTFSVSGGAAMLSDAAPTAATIPANATTVTVTLATEDDNTDEPNATLTLTLADGAAYDLGSDRAATLTVQDNDDTPELTVADAAAAEDADLVFAINLDPASSGTVTVNYAITPNTAQAADYTGTTSGKVTFTPGETSKDVTLKLVDDTADEPEETVTLTLSGPTGTASIADGTATGTITDNDLPVVTVTAGGDITEGADAQFTLTRASQDTGAALPVTFSITGGAAMLTNAAPTSATIPANATTVTVTLATTDDNTDEPNATLTLTLADGAAYDLGSDDTATLTVQDNDGAPALSANDASAAEDADLVFTINLNPASSGTVTVNYAITADTAQAADYTGTTSGKVTFAPGDTSKDVTLELVDDTTDEPDETVTLTLSDPTGTASIADGTATGAITDNDLPVVTVTAGGDITEGADAQFTLTRASQDTGAALPVTFSVSGGAAMLSDAAPTAATIPANATTVTVTLATEDDNTDEPNATLTLTLADGAAYDLGSDRAATLTVQDNDDTPELTVADAAAAEDADLVFAINLDPASSGTVTVNYAITPNTAQAADYTGTTSGKVTFTPGETSKDVTLKLVDDTADEPEETVTLTLSGPTGTASIADGTATGTITDNDLPVVTVTAGGDITEGADAQFTLTRASQDTGAALPVTFSITGGAAMLTNAAPTSATIPANATTVTVTLATTDDNTDEPNATLTLTLADGAAYDLGSDDTATLTVQDNDGAPALTANDASASEDADLVFAINLNPASSGTVTVNYAITPDTAQAADYTGTTSGKVTFTPGDTSKNVTLELVDDALDEPEETVTLTLSGPTGTASIADATATGTITDNDLPSVTVTSGGDITEGADAQFTLTRASQDTGAALEVTFSVSGGAAMLTAAAPTAATIPANATTALVTMATTDDNTDEPNATLTLTLTDGAAYDLGTPSVATLTVQDNDGAPALSANDASAAEDADLVFTINLNPASSGTVTVNYAITPDTAQAADYTGTTSGKVTFTPGDTSKNVTLELVDDALDEPEETVTLTLSNQTGTASIEAATATGTITDNDLPSVTVTSGGDITEGADAQFTLTRASQDTGAALPVTFSITGGAAMLTNAAPTAATIPADATTVTVTLATTDDNTDEPNATLTLTLTDGAAYDLGSDDTATLTVQDNDGAPALSANDASAAEDADLVFTINLNPASSGTVTVNYAITADTAQAADYTGTTSGKVTFAPGDTSKDVTLELVDDTTDEPDETVTLTLSDPTGTASIADGTATGAITDNDLPVVTVTAGGDITEGADAQFTLTRASQDTGAALPVTFSVSGGAAMLSDAAPTAATIPANATTVTVTLATEDDNTDEPNATLTLTLADGAAYDLGSDRAATLTVQDNDDTPELTVADAAAAEDADLVFAINLDPASSGTVTVNYAITPNTAQAADYTGTTSGKVTFTPGETSKDVTLKLVDDTADEPEETVTLTLSGPTGTASIADGTATGTITDNDLPVVTVTAGGDITEGADAQFTLTRASQDTGAALPVTFSITGGAAMLTNAAPTSATIPANATTVTVTLATTDDNTDEPNATLTLTLADGAAYDLGSDDTATLTVQDNDGAPALTANDASASEDADLVFAINLNPASSGTVTVNYAITPDTAQAADYTGTTSGKVTFTPGDTSKNVTLELVDDALDEPEETVTLTLSGPTGTASIADATATGTITDNDLPSVTVTSGGDITEGADAQFTLTRASQDTGAALPVTFSVTDPGAALTDAAPTSATIPADATTVTVSLATEDDNTDEPNATLTLTLTDGAAYDLGSDRTATLTVQDNDLPVMNDGNALPHVTIVSATELENGEVVFTLRRTGNLSVPLVVRYQVVYRGQGVTLREGYWTFAEGSSTLEIRDPEFAEGIVTEADRTVELTLLPPDDHASGYVVGDPSEATLRVAGTPRPALSVADAAASEDANLVFALTLSPASELSVTVDYAITPGTAQAEDYTGTTSGTVTFAPGDTSKNVTLDVVDDSIAEPDETVTLTLTVTLADRHEDDRLNTGFYHVGTARIADATATGTITDNDLPVEPPDGNDLPVVTVAAGGDVTEGESAEFTLTRDGVTTEALPVTFSVTGGDAVLNDDAPTSATIPANTTTVTVTLATTDDNTDEPDATLTLTLTDGAAYDLGSDSAATLTVADNDDTINDELPVVTVTSGGNVTEGESAEFTLTRDGVTTEALPVTFSVTGGGSALSDDPPTSATIPANETTATVRLATEDDNIDEPDATLTLTLTDGDAYDLGSDSAATLTVADNDDTINDELPVVTVTSGGNVTEGESAEFTLTRDGVTTEALPVTFSVSDPGSALTNAAPTSATIPANQTTVTVALTTEDDNIDEPDATLTLTLTDGDAYDLGSDRAATLTVQDNDDTPELTVADASASEDANLVFELTLNPASSQEVTVNYAITADTAQAADYTGTTSGSVTFAPGDTTKDVTLELVDDALDEPDETVTLTLSGPTGTASIADATATGTITDNDLPVVTVAAGGDITEGADAEFTLTRASQDTGKALSVTFSVSDPGSALTAAAPTAATIPANQTTATVALATEDDNIDEPDATLTLTLTDGAAYDLGSDRAATLTVADNDDTTNDELPVVTVTSGGNVTEGESVEFTLTRDGVTTEALPVTFSVSGGGSALNDDPPTSATIPANETTATVTLATEDDNIDEPDATLTLTLTDGDAYDLGSDRTATLTVQDNDDTPELTVADASASEDANLVFELTLNPASSGTVTVNYAITPDTAQTADYTGTTSGALTFAPGDTVKKVTLNLVDDAAAEPDETVTLTLSGLTGTASIADGAATGTITDNDLQVVTIESATETENGEVVFTLRRRGNLSVPLVIRYQVVYRGQGVTLREGYRTFAEGSSTLEMRDPEFVEGIVTEADRTVELTLLPPDDHASGYVVGDPSEATLRVAGTPRPALSVADAAASEDANLVFALTLNPASELSVTVDYAITPGTAQTGDYTGTTSGSVTFAPGDTSKNVTLDVVDDSIAEPDETVTLTLTLPDQPEDDRLDPGFYRVGTARIADATATGTIGDNDLDEKPGTVRHLSVSVDTGKLTISWEAPDAGGRAAGYDVDYELAGSADGWTTALDGGEATSVTITGLAPGDYRIRVRATNPYGNSRWVRDRVTVGD